MTAGSAEEPYSVKLIDFGLGIKENMFIKGTPLCGSPGFIAPELFEKNDFVGQKSDIYSCGIVLYCL